MVYCSVARSCIDDVFFSGYQWHCGFGLIRLMRSPASVKGLVHARQVRNVANTGCVPWGGKLLATFEAGQVRPGQGCSIRLGYCEGT